MSEVLKYDEYAILMNRIGQWLVKNKVSFKKRDAYGYFGRSADRGTIEKVLLERANRDEWGADGLTAEYVECAIHDNAELGFLPTYVTAKNGTKYYKDAYVDMARRVSAYEVLNGASPLTVRVNPEATTSTGGKTVSNEFIKRFGDFHGSIDEALGKIQGRGYGYYYDDRYNTIPTLDAMLNRKGVNCTDSAQVFYRIAIENGYECNIIHVKCNGGDGHVRLRLKKNGVTFYRDPASVLSGGAVSSNWCLPPAYQIAIDPAWVFAQLYL